MRKSWVVSECKIEKGADSRNLRSVGKSEVGNPTTNLWDIPGRNRDLSSSGSIFRASRNYSAEGCVEWDAQNWHFTKNLHVKIRSTLRILHIREIALGEFKPESAGMECVKITFLGDRNRG